MANRNTPFGAFNYLVEFDGGEILGGFSDVSGIGSEIKVAEYRNGNEKENHTRKVAGIHTAGDITGKRVIAGKISPVEETKARVATSPASAASSTPRRSSTGSRPPASTARTPRRP